MKINNRGLALLQSLEGCKLTAYKLKGEKNFTIGYGHNSADIKAGDKITTSQAVELLKMDLEKFEKYVSTYAVKKFPALNENQFSALVSYCYNRGLGGLKQLVNNSNNVIELGNNIVKYWGSNTNYKTALINRRKKEKDLYFLECKLVIPKPVLRRGSLGQEVAYLQKFLNVFGYKLKEDGSFGQKTYDALYNFQEKHAGCGIPDGVFGKKTHKVFTQIVGG